jgi:hypothetical protein
MARKLTGLGILALVLGLTSFALAQQPAMSGPGGLLFNPDVKKDLKMSDEQATKLRDSLSKVMTKYKGDFEKFQKNPPSAKEYEKTMRAFQEDSEKAVAGVLDAKQLKRFRQIEWQLNGVFALQDPDLQKELKINDEQKKKLEGIFQNSAKQYQQLQEKRETSKAKYDDVFKEAQEKANGVLTEEQKKSWKEAQGPKFSLSQPAPAPSDKR